jgi:hypothetical protein
MLSLTRPRKRDPLLPARKRAKPIFKEALSQSTCAAPTLPYDLESPTSVAVEAKEVWLRCEPAIYLSLGQGFDFGL